MIGHRSKLILTSLLIIIGVFSGCVYAYITLSKTHSHNTKMDKKESKPSKVEKITINLDSSDSTKNLIPIIHSNKIPIIYYHCISDNIFGLTELFVSPSEFDKQMEFLKQNQYTPITFADLNNAQNISKPVIITLDDGYENNYTEAYPILKKHGLKATILLPSEFVDANRMLKTYQVKEMLDIIDFQAHTVSHPDLTLLDDQKLEFQLSHCKEVLQKLTNKPVDTLAYPSGKYNQKVINISKKYYKYGLSIISGMYHLGDNPYTIKRLYIPRSLKLNGFIEKLNTK